MFTVQNLVSRVSKFVVLTGAIGLLITTGASTASATAPVSSPVDATAAAAPAGQETADPTSVNQYCQVLLSGSETDASGNAVVLGRTCWDYTKQQADTATKGPYRGARPKSTGAQEAAPASTQSASLLIFSMYENTYANQFTAGRSQSVYIDGPYYIAPCDATGYHSVLDSTWSGIVSSFRQGDVSCPKLKILNKALTAYAEIPANSNSLGGYNDNVGKVYAHA